MASIQCHKPANYEACPKNCQNKAANESSLGQKVSEMASFLKGGLHGQHSSRSNTQCLATKTNGNGQHGLTQHHASNGMACYGKTKKRDEHKNKKSGGNLLQKIRDGISGHSSESDSEDEGGCRKKN